MGVRLEIPIGTRFGKLTVLGEGRPARYGKSKQVSRTLQCVCDCGNEVDVPLRALRHHGRHACSKSCAATVHGMSRRGQRDPMYTIWQGIMARCGNPSATGYQYWGGRGIQLHAPWHDPRVFAVEVEAEIGPRPGILYSLDRKDVNGNYEPGNIRWLLKTEQPLNRRKVYYATEVQAMLAAHHCGGCRCFAD